MIFKKVLPAMALVMLVGCSPETSVPETPAPKPSEPETPAPKININAIKLSSQKITQGYPLNISVSSDGENVVYSYLLKKGEILVKEYSNAGDSLQIEEADFPIGKINVAITVKDTKQNISAQKDTVIEIREPLLGVANINDLKKDIIKAEEKKKGKKTEAFKLFSNPQYDENKIEVLYYRNHSDSTQHAYFFHNDTLVGGESHILRNQSYALLMNLVEKGSKHYNKPAEKASETFVEFSNDYEEFSASDFIKAMDAKDYKKIDLFIKRGNYAVLYRWIDTEEMLRWGIQSNEKTAISLFSLLHKKGYSFGFW